MTKHAFLSASGASAWTKCPAKPFREMNEPNATNAAAEEGTAAHELLQSALILNVPAEEARKASLSAYQSDIKWFTPDMSDEVQKTIDLIASLKTADTRLYCEQTLALEFLTGEKDATCTADVILVDEHKLTILDLKYGMGVQVDAVNNEQLLIYAICAAKAYEVANCNHLIEMIISQPRLDSVSRWELTYAELKERGEDLSAKAKHIFDTMAAGQPLTAVPGESQCRFCKHKSNCKELAKHNFDIITLDFSEGLTELSVKDKVELSKSIAHTAPDATIADYVDNIALIRSWCDAVEEELYTRLTHDNFDDPRYKLVQGRAGNRKFASDKDVEDICKQHNATDIYNTSLISPAQLEKRYPKKAYPVMWGKLESLTNRSEGRPIVVGHDDPRPALNLALSFDPVEDDEMTDALLGLNPDVLKK